MKNCEFVCDKPGENSFATSEGMEVDRQIEIDESTDLSEVIKFNSNGCVYGVNLKFNKGIFRYILNVDARGPQGMGSGSGILKVTDAIGDEYSLKINSSSRKNHTLKYNSRLPNIVKVRWESTNGINELSEKEINESATYLEVSNENLEDLKKELNSPIIKQLGSWNNIIGWDADFHLDTDDITRSYLNITISLLGIDVVNTCLDFKNPKINIDATVLNVGMIAECGINFDKRIVYLKGKINLILTTQEIDIILLKF